MYIHIQKTQVKEQLITFMVGSYVKVTFRLDLEESGRLPGRERGKKLFRQKEVHKKRDGKMHICFYSIR